MAITLLINVLVSGLGIFLVSYLCLCLALLIWQNRLIFLPSAPLEATPAQVGLSYQDVTVPVLTWQGKLAQLHGWWIPNPSSPDVLLYLHGNEGNISVNLGPVQTLYQAGFSVLAIDYRGYGQSKGDFPKESEVYRDAQAAWKYLVKTQGILPQHIFLYGHSLGGSIAIDLAVRYPVAGVIVDGTFTSMRDMARYHPIYNLFPIELILTQRFDSLAKLSLLQSPLLVIHGSEDRKVPASLGQILFESATVPKKLFLIPSAGHENTVGVAGNYYLKAVREFKELVRSQGGKRQQAKQNGFRGDRH